MAPKALGWIRILIHLTCFTPSPNQGTKGPKLNTSHCIMVLYGVGTFVNISGQMHFKLIFILFLWDAVNLPFLNSSINL